MKESIKFKGIWWLPENENQKIHGTLSFSQETGIFLETSDIFDLEKFAQFQSHPIILGISQNGKKITLSNCQYSKGNINYRGFGSSILRSQFMFSGVHFFEELQIRFYKLSVSCTDLDVFVDTNGFDIQDEVVDEKLIVRIKYEKPNSKKVKINDQFEVGVGFSFSGPNRSIVQSEISMQQQTYLIVRSINEEIPFKEIFRIINEFINLLQLATQRLPYFIKVIGYFNQANDNHLNPIEVYFQPIESIKSKKSIIPQELLFSYNDLTDKQIVNWFKIYPKYQNAIHLYSSLFFEERLFIETRFINIVQALEVLYNSKFGSKVLKEHEFKRKILLVLNYLPDDMKGWVNGVMSNSNYVPLKPKIKNLLTQKSDFLEGLINDFDDFSSKVRDTRNEFIHQTKHKKTFHNKDELVISIMILTFLFEIYLLELVGFSDKKTMGLVKAKNQSLITGWKHLRTG